MGAATAVVWYLYSCTPLAFESGTVGLSTVFWDEDPLPALLKPWPAK